MADVNLTQDEFLTLSGLGYFKGKQDSEINAKDAKVLQDAKDYFDGRVDEFDQAGSAVTEAGTLNPVVVVSTTADASAKAKITLNIVKADATPQEYVDNITGEMKKIH